MDFKQKTQSLMYPTTILLLRLLIAATLSAKTKCLVIPFQRIVVKSTAFVKRPHKLLMSPRYHFALFLEKTVIVILEVRSYMEPMIPQLLNPKSARFYGKKMLHIMGQATATPNTFKMSHITKDVSAKSQAHLVITSAKWTRSTPRILGASLTNRCLNLN